MDAGATPVSRYQRERDGREREVERFVHYEERQIWRQEQPDE